MLMFSDFTEADIEYARFAAQVMKEICEYHPGRLTMAELTTRLQSGNGLAADDVTIGATALVENGAVRREHDCLVPTMPGAYVYFLSTLQTHSPW